MDGAIATSVVWASYLSEILENSIRIVRGPSRGGRLLVAGIFLIFELDRKSLRTVLTCAERRYVHMQTNANQLGE